MRKTRNCCIRYQGLFLTGPAIVKADSALFFSPSPPFPNNKLSCLESGKQYDQVHSLPFSLSLAKIPSLVDQLLSKQIILPLLLVASVFEHNKVLCS